MSLNNIIRPASQVQTSQGRPLAGGNVYLYAPGTTTFITAYNGSDLVTPLPQPVPLSGSGRANIWITRDVDMFIYDRNGNLVLTELNANPDALDTDTGSGLVPNGSFEDDTDANDVPDGWTEVALSGSNNGIDTTRSTDGAKSFRFTSTGVGGGSLVTTDFFPVTDLQDLSVFVDIQGSILGPNNRVRVEWYTVLFVLISNSDPYNVTNTPVGVWTSLTLTSTPPATARFAKLRLIGIDPSVPFSGSTWFDRVNVFYPATGAGTFNNIRIQNNEIISLNTNGVIDIKPNGTGSLNLGQGSVGAPLYAANANGGSINLQKSRNAVYGSHTIVQAADTLGSLGFAGSNGTAFVVAADIFGAVDGTPGAGTDMPGRLIFRTVPDGSATLTERVRIDSAGKVTISGLTYSAQFVYGSSVPWLAVMSGTSDGIASSRNSADVNGAFLFLSKSRNTNQGSHTIVQSGDAVGRIDFRGSDGATMQSLGYIEGAVDGTPGVSDMPGRLMFFTTPDGSATPVERLRLSQASLDLQNPGAADIPFIARNSVGGVRLVTLASGQARIDQTNSAGTAEDIWLSFTRNGAVTGYRNNLANWFGASQGFGVQSTTGSSTLLDLYSSVGGLEGRVITFNSGNMTIRSELVSRGVDLVGLNSVSAYASLLSGDPNGILALYFNGNDRLRTQVNGGSAGNSANVSPASGVGQMLFNGSGYTGAVALDGTAMYIGHNSGSRGLNLVTNSTQLGVAITAGGAVGLYNNGAEELRTQLATGAANTSGAEVRDFGGVFRDVGFNVMPFATNNSATTLSRTHLSTLQAHLSGTVAWTTPASSDTDFPTGGIINGVSSAAGLTIAAGSGMTLNWFTGATVTTGTRTIAAGGVFTLLRASASEFYIWGSGIS